MFFKKKEKEFNIDTLIEYLNFEGNVSISLKENDYILRKEKRKDYFEESFDVYAFYLNEKEIFIFYLNDKIEFFKLKIKEEKAKELLKLTEEYVLKNKTNKIDNAINELFIENRRI